MEVERNRLARELHDNVSNELVAIRMEIEGGKSTPQEIMNTLKTLHTEVRAISHDLMPPVFKYATLPEILEDYVSQRDKSGKAEITYRFNRKKDGKTYRKIQDWRFIASYRRSPEMR